MVLSHVSVAATVAAGETAFNRNVFTLSSNPIGGRHRVGTYLIKITGPPNTVFHMWCEQDPPQGIRVLVGNNPPMIPGIEVTDDNTLSSWACGDNVITVASYDDRTGKIAPTSSVGKPVQYKGDKKVLLEKPDIAAPGENILAARSADHQFPTANLATLLGLKYTEKSGTSMATPHVAGVIALMLKKKWPAHFRRDSGEDKNKCAGQGHFRCTITAKKFWQRKNRCSTGI